MNIRTYEIIAKYIGKQNKIHIKFEPGLETPCADVENDILRFPDTIGEDNIFAGLATLMHEAAHIRHTKKIPHKQLATCPAEFNVLNAIEDIRIDKKNFSLLPNVYDFYEELMKHIQARNDKLDMSQVPLPNKVLMNAIMELEGFNAYKIKDKQADAFSQKHNIVSKISHTINDIENSNWTKAKQNIDDLVKIFGWDKNPPPQMPGFITGKGKVGMGNPNGDGDGDKGDGGDKGEEGIGIELGGDKALYKGANGQGKGTIKVTDSLLGSIGLQEQTKQKFKELLNLKEHRIIEDGNKLDIDNLPAFFTGAIDELFIEDKVIHTKRSKIMLLLDASGSMDATLLCGKKRKHTVGACIKEVIKILDEVCETEGLEVDYDIAGFTEDYHPFKKETWEKEYSCNSGGTDALNAFIKAQDTLLKSQETDGHKLIIMFSDGEVGSNEIAEMKKRILQHNADVRCMIIGVGADLKGPFVDDIVGDFNIISSEASDQILMEAIMTMLE